MVWDVTNPRQARGPAPLDGSGSFVAPADTLREYVAFQPSGNFNTPRAFGKGRTNQDLHALNGNASALLDLVIVTYPAFQAQAQRLADHRRPRQPARGRGDDHRSVQRVRLGRAGCDGHSRPDEAAV